MAITSSAKKALRSSRRKAVFNARRKRAIKDVSGNIRKLVAAGKRDEARALISTAYTAIDKALKGNYLKKNTAARKKSRLARLVQHAKA